MKRVVSILLALVLVLSLSVNAFAAENKGSITISNATIGQTYTVYKIFDASVKKSEDGNTEAIAYTIDTSNQFFYELFPNAKIEDSTDPYANEYLIYTPSTETSGGITKRATVNNTDLIKYLMKLVYNEVEVKDEQNNPVYNADGTKKTEFVPKENVTDTASKEAEAKELQFTGLDYGYYLITSSLGTTVTINSADPDVTVIDKNQDPVPDFDKQVQTNVGQTNPTWGDHNSAEIGDRFSYRISFTATNYDGDKQIQYYQIHDEKGDAIWAEFNSFQVKVNGVPLTKGYYLSQGGVNTGNWRYLGNGWGENLPNDDTRRDEADWYLVHLGYDEFRITIPWLNDHYLTDNYVDGKVASYTLGFDSETSKYGSPVQVEIIYDAVLEANAAIGQTSHGNRFNKAYASWTSTHETGSVSPDEVTTYTYGIGLLKDDLSTGQNLAGAKFRIYSDAKCTQPVNVIPTDLAGVYIVDSLDKPITTVTGTGKQASREVMADRISNYAEILREYLKDDKGEAITQNNLVVSQVNGKLAVLGLKAGTYYLKEVEAPAGYNALSAPVEMKAGDNIRPFIIFADANGNVADIQATDGVHSEHKLDLTHTVVHNSKGVELPSTGGKGTMVMITIGTMIAMAFAVLLITQKKMTIYHD